MINHVRTLLLNRSQSYCSGLERNAYIPSEFTPVPLSTELTRMRDAIIPPNGSKQQEVDAVNAVAQILSSPELIPYAMSLDDRITYLYTAKNTDPADLTSKNLALTMAKSEACDITPEYTYAKSNALQPVAGVYAWSVRAFDTRRVQVTNTKGMTELVNLNPSSSSTKSLPLEIIPGYLTLYFTLPTKEFTGAFNIRYELTVHGTYNVVQALDAMKQAMALGANIFEDASLPAIMPVLRSVWLHDPASVTRFGAGVMAYVYTLEGLRA